jgi:hypothetical protein
MLTRVKMKRTIFVTAICVGLVAMMSTRAAEKAENPSLAILSDNNAGASEKVTAIEAYVRSVEKIFPPPNAKNRCSPQMS